MGLFCKSKDKTKSFFGLKSAPKDPETMQTTSCKTILKEKILVSVREERCLSPVFTQCIARGN